MAPRATQPITRPRKAIQDPEDLQGPRLGITLRVYGRETRGKRVYYQLRPGDTERHIPEDVVLIRWRTQRVKGRNFSGVRLNPRFWRALAAALPGEPGTWVKLTEPQLQAHRAAWMGRRARAEEGSLPTPHLLWGILKACGAQALRALIARHTDPARSDCYGTPDLFLMAKTSDGRRLPDARFVEVKRFDERLHGKQAEEIHFLKSVGLKAQVIRLQERGA